jgi:hypothetical protein
MRMKSSSKGKGKHSTSDEYKVITDMTYVYNKSGGYEWIN